MKKFKVWFEQVNQVMIEVDAKDDDAAQDKAARVWRRDYGHNHASYIEESKPNE